MPARFSVVKTPDAWNAHLDKLSRDQREISLRYEYPRLFSLSTDSIPAAALFSGTYGMLGLYPFAIRPVPHSPEPWYDIESAYGYAGPLVQNFHPRDMETFEELFHQWCMDNRVVAEFIRFHPLQKNHTLFRRNIDIAHNRVTVPVDLRHGWDTMWRECRPNKRRNMRKAVRHGLEARFGKAYQQFADLYYDTMTRLGADPYYFFSRNLFEGLADLNDRSAVLLEILYQGQVVAGGVFLFDESTLHYFLGGSTLVGRDVAANDFLMFKIMEWGCRKGFTCFHLGGGTSLEPNDGLMRFKAGFSPLRADFFIGKRIHRPETYATLMSNWHQRTGKPPRLFLQYHFD